MKSYDGYTECSFGRIWFISHGLSTNEQYFSLTPNQSTVLSAMVYKLSQPKRTRRNLPAFYYLLAHARGASLVLWSERGEMAGFILRRAWLGRRG